jgi:hypothetical protein
VSTKPITELDGVATARGPESTRVTVTPWKKEVAGICGAPFLEIKKPAGAG